MTQPTTRLFVYGTLMPGAPRWPMLRPFVVAQPTPARMPGALFDTGLGYPAAFDDPDVGVPGVLVHLRPDLLTEALQDLDAIEGVGAGLFERVLREVEGAGAWTYLGGHPQLRHRRIASWR